MPKNYSKYSLLEKYYEAKKYYYGTQDAIMTDNEFNALEQSIAVIHGPETLRDDGTAGTWACVGYDKDIHDLIKKNLDIARKKFYIKKGYEVPGRLFSVNENEKYTEPCTDLTEKHIPRKD